MYQEPSEEDFKQVFDPIFEKLRSPDSHYSPALIFLSNAERDQVEALEDKVDPICWGYREHNERTSIRNKYSMAVSIRLAKKENPIERHERVSTDALNCKASEIKLAWSKVRFLLCYFDIEPSDGMEWYRHSFETNLSVGGERHNIYITSGIFSRGGRVRSRIGSKVEGPVLDERELEVPRDQEFFLKIDIGDQFPAMTYRENDIPKIISEVTEMIRAGAYLGITRKQERLLSYLMTRPLIKIEKSRHDYRADEDDSKKKEKIKPKNIARRNYKEDNYEEWVFCNPSDPSDSIITGLTLGAFEKIAVKIISQEYGKPLILNDDERDEVDKYRSPDIGLSICDWNSVINYLSWNNEFREITPIRVRSCDKKRYGKMTSLALAKAKGIKKVKYHDSCNATLLFCKKITETWVKARFLMWYFEIHPEFGSERFLEAGYYNKSNEWVDEVIYYGEDRKNLDCTEIIDEISFLLKIGAYLGLTRKEEALLKRAMLESDLGL